MERVGEAAHLAGVSEVLSLGDADCLTAFEGLDAPLIPALSRAGEGARHGSSTRAPERRQAASSISPAALSSVSSAASSASSISASEEASPNRAATSGA